MSRLYEKYAVDGALTYAEMTKYNRLSNLEKQLAAIMRETNNEVVKTIDRLASVNYEESFFRTGWAVDQAVGVNLKWGLLNPKTVKAAVENELDKIAKYRLKVDSLTRVRSAVTQGLIRGTSYPQMARVLRDSILGKDGGGASVYEAVRIARTEGARAQILGMQSGLDDARNAGVELVEIWDATLDGDTRPEHGALDGKEKQDQGWYVPGIGWVSGPLQSGVPSFDINCRCAVRGEVKGLEPELRRVRGEGVVPYTTYDDWKANIEKNGGQYKPSKRITLPEEMENFERNTGVS